MRSTRLTLLIALILGTIGAAPTFESHWQDGKAELDGYRYRLTRYGEERQGTAVMIYVTEPFSEVKRVKVDHPGKGRQDTFEALKVNFVRDFQTGIYDYGTMVSLFVRSRDLSPVKITFSSAEWCGHVYEEMLYEKHHVADHSSSYFEGESGLRRLALRDKGITEEELLVRLRELRGDWLQGGERRTVPFLSSAFYRRLTHTPLLWTEATIERSRGTESVAVPAGRFETSLYTVRTHDYGRVGRFWVERAHPHRIVRWEWRPAERQKGGTAGAERGWRPGEGLDSGELTGSARLPYWTLNGVGNEKYLRQLGLAGAESERTSGGSRARPR